MEGGTIAETCRRRGTTVDNNDAAAKIIAEALGYSWDGLPDKCGDGFHMICERLFNANKQSFRDIADEIARLRAADGWQAGRTAGIEEARQAAWQAWTACTDVGETGDSIYSAVKALAAAPPASPSAERSELEQRVMGAISDFAGMQPEPDETWESWYPAAFDLLCAKTAKLFHAASPSSPQDDESEAEKIVRSAWKIISRLEERAVEDTMYDGRPVEEWCDRAIKYLGDDTCRESQSNALADELNRIIDIAERTSMSGDWRYGLGQIQGVAADLLRRARGE